MPTKALANSSQLRLLAIHLVTFITPFGHYCSSKVPFGISSTPEHFQRRMSSGLGGIVCQIDDVLISGRFREQCDVRYEIALIQIKSLGITLVKVSRQEKTQRLGHIICKNGTAADAVHHSKVTAIADMKAPENISKLRCFLGMANQLGKFTYQLAVITQHLHE